MSSEVFPASRSERLERLRAQLQGRPAIARQAGQSQPHRDARLLYGVMLRGAARLDAGMELTDLEQRLVDILSRLLGEDETREFGRVFLEETAARDAQERLPATLTARGLAEGYSQADLLKDLPNLSEELRAQPNVSIIDLAERDQDAPLDSPEFVQGMADYGIGVTVVHSSQQDEAGTDTDETPFDIRLDFHKFLCRRDTPEATKDEIYWVYAGSNAEGVAQKQVTREYGKVRTGSQRWFDENTTLFSGQTTKGIPGYIACWEADDSPGSWYNGLRRVLDDIIKELQEFGRIIQGYPAGQWPDFNASDLADYGIIIAYLIKALIEWIRNDDDLVQERVIAFSRRAMKATANRYGATDYWNFKSSEGHFELYVTANPPSATRLRHATSADGSTWSSSTLLPFAASVTGPALATYKNSLYCVHRGGADYKLRWRRFDGNGWSAGAELGAHNSYNTPALAVHGDELFCVHTGAINDDEEDNFLWYTRFNGSTWSRDQVTGLVRSPFQPALATAGRMTPGPTELFCFYRGEKDSNLWWMRFDGSRWVDHHRLGSHQSSDGPAAVNYNGQIYVVYRGLSTSDLWWCTFDAGGQVSAGKKFGVPTTGGTPALAVFNNKLYCLHRGGHGNPKLYWTVFNGTGWEPDTRIGTTTTAHAPAAAAYNGKLHLVHRGGGIL